MMSRVHVAFVAAIVSILLYPTSQIRAEDQPPDVENGKQSVASVLNASSVFIRSGPSDNYYPTMKLNKGDQVIVVGMKFDWLKIVPPDGSFSYVPKAYVEKFGDGSKGRINQVKQDVPVRAGSALNDVKTTVQTRLQPGDEVEILGEKDEYWKIKPPASAYVFVHKQFVDPVKPVENPAVASGQNAAPTTEKAVEGAANNGAAVAGETPKSTDTSTADASTQPSDATSVAMASSQPTTAPTQSAEAEYDKLEAEFAEVSKKPIEEQPVPDLLTRYEALSKNSELPSSLLRVVDLRISALKVRSDTREQFLALKKIQEESQKKQTALKAEKQELEDRIKKGPTIYTAVGTLQMSSLQTGRGGTLFRLTDPATGRTVVYLRSDDAKYNSLIGQFIGVRGDVVVDDKLNLKCITPKSAEAVDPLKVNDTVAAQIIPPSLVPQASTANP